MPKLVVYNSVSLDGFFTDANGDMSWAHKQDAQWKAFVAENAKGGAKLVFGRATYDLMTQFWPTPEAKQMNPLVAERMNNLPKVVFSRTMEKASWNNTTLVKADIVSEMRKMKNEPGDDMTIMGSGTIVSQFAQAGLIDEFRIVVNPIVLGKGRSMFEGVERTLNLRLTSSRAFDNGNVVQCYEPAPIS
jgi:dihydrofolate reductase